jgi:hypothetical protein
MVVAGTVTYHQPLRRRQRRLKVNGPIIDHSAIPSTYHASFNCNRPLPPVANQHSQLTNSPSLMDGYGVVADDIAQGCNDQISQSSAYADMFDGEGSAQFLNTGI